MDAIARPFGALLMLIYDNVGNYGLALIILAVIVMMILLPFAMKAKPGQIRQARLQPKIAEIRKRHGDNKQKINEETQKLYKEEGINPASGCLWGFLPLPIILILFQVIRQPLTHMIGIPAEFLAHEAVVNLFYSLLPNGEWSMPAAWQQIEQAQLISVPANLVQFQHIATTYFPELIVRGINFNFLGLNLGLQPQWNFFWTTDWSDASIWLPGFGLFMIPLVSGGAQFVHTIINKKINPAMSGEGMGQMGTMMMLMPLLSVWFGFMFPAALGLYWTVQSIIRVGQEVWITKRYTKVVDAEEAVRKAQRDKREAELEAKRLETERKRAEGIAERDKNTSKRKKNISEKQEQIERAAEWQKKNASKVQAEEVFEPSRVGNRKYARGRAYDPDRFPTFESIDEAESSAERRIGELDNETDYDEEINNADDTSATINDADSNEYSQQRDDVVETSPLEDSDNFEVVEDFEVVDDDIISGEISDGAYDQENPQDEIPAADEQAAKSTVSFETARFEDNSSKE